jgi:hypothetical protein
MFMASSWGVHGWRCNVAISHTTGAPAMLEEALDPRPAAPLDFARLLAESTSRHTVSADVLAQVWYDDVSFWSNVRTVEYWIDRAHR